VDSRLPATVTAAATAPPPGGAGTKPSVAAAISRRIRSRTDAELNECIQRWPTLDGQRVALVVTGDAETSELTCAFPTVAGAAGPAGPPVATVIADAAIWQSVLDGQANVITELRHGRLRCLNRRDAYRLRSDEVHALA